jgi:hypothetical protein
MDAIRNNGGNNQGPGNNGRGGQGGHLGAGNPGH